MSVDDAMPLSGFYGPEDWMPVPAADSAEFLSGDEPSYEDDYDEPSGQPAEQEATDG